MSDVHQRSGPIGPTAGPSSVQPERDGPDGPSEKRQVDDSQQSPPPPPQTQQDRPELPWAFIDCPTDTLVELISHMLNLLIQHNDQVVLTPDALTRFHSRAAPGISVVDYLRRIVKYTNMEKIPLLSLLAYIDLTCSHLPTFTLSTLTVHRFLIAGVCAGSKAQCDVFCTNAHYAKVGGIKVQELNALEREFLRVTQWALCCNADLLQRYYTSLIRSHGGFTQQVSPDQSPFRTFPRSLSKPRAPVSDVDVDLEGDGQVGAEEMEGDEEDDAMEGEGADNGSGIGGGGEGAEKGGEEERGRRTRRRSVEEVLGVQVDIPDDSRTGEEQMDVDDNDNDNDNVKVRIQHDSSPVTTTHQHPASASTTSSPNAFLRPSGSQPTLASPSARTSASSYISTTSASASASASSSPQIARTPQLKRATSNTDQNASPSSSSVPSSSRSSMHRVQSHTNAPSSTSRHRRGSGSSSAVSISSASISSRGRSGRGRAPSLSYSISSAQARPAEAVLDRRVAVRPGSTGNGSPIDEGHAGGLVKTPDILGRRYALEPAGGYAYGYGHGHEHGSASGIEHANGVGIGSEGDSADSARDDAMRGQGEEEVEAEAGSRVRTESGSSARTELGRVGGKDEADNGGIITSASESQQLNGHMGGRRSSGSHGHAHGPGGGRLLKNLVGVFKKRSSTVPTPTSMSDSGVNGHPSTSTSSAPTNTNGHASHSDVATDSSHRPLKSPRLTHNFDTRPGQARSASRDVRMSLSMSPTALVAGIGGTSASVMAEGEMGGLGQMNPPHPSHVSTPARQVASAQSQPPRPFAQAQGQASSPVDRAPSLTPRVRRREPSGDGVAV